MRHGETAWSLSGRHTGRSDIPLTAKGEADASALGSQLRSVRFNYVLTSPLQRARRTCELAGLLTQAEIDPNLVEWDYGKYEGETSVDIHKTRPSWNLFQDGCPGGESPAQITARADRLIDRLKSLSGNIAIFTHGHFGRVLAARFLGLPASDAARFHLDTASLSILEFDSGKDAAASIVLWNAFTQEENPALPRPLPATDPFPAGHATIQMHLKELAQLFDSLDHSPFREKDLDRNAEDYIVESFKQLSPTLPCALTIYLDASPGSADEEKIVEQAVRVHFARQSQVLRRKLQRLIRLGSISLAIGLSFLATFFLIGQLIRNLLGESQWGLLVREGLIIGGWVAMWKPLEVFLYDWWPILSEQRLHERLSRLTVRLVYGDKATRSA
jgi:broad specificity phosphatase PhoE